MSDDVTVLVMEEPSGTVLVDAGDVIVRIGTMPAGTVEIDDGTPLVQLTTDPSGQILVAAGQETVLLEAPVIDVVSIGVQGPPGPPGPAGAEGAPGTPGSAPQAYTHDQQVPATVWTITHQLGYVPNVTVFNTLGDEVIGETQHPSPAQTVLIFTAAFSGRAFLS